jgi:hypothetical protein
MELHFRRTDITQRFDPCSSPIKPLVFGFTADVGTASRAEDRPGKRERIRIPLVRTLAFVSDPPRFTDTRVLESRAAKFTGTLSGSGGRRHLRGNHQDDQAQPLALDQLSGSTVAQIQATNPDLGKLLAERLPSSARPRFWRHLPRKRRP